MRCGNPGAGIVLRSWGVEVRIDLRASAAQPFSDLESWCVPADTRPKLLRIVPSPCTGSRRQFQWWDPEVSELGGAFKSNSLQLYRGFFASTFPRWLSCCPSADQVWSQCFPAPVQRLNVSKENAVPSLPLPSGLQPSGSLSELAWGRGEHLWEVLSGYRAVSVLGKCKPDGF